jgi:putative FmdB family regulatory protein
MPIYEYRCGKGHTFEVMQRMSDDPLVVCETCEAPVQRVFHPVAVHFKGSGFYNTDYGKRSRARDSSEAKSSDSSSSDTKSGDSSSSDSKPETKSATKSETKSDAKTSTSPD